ncbi:MAG TPA: hypothetical protein VLA36_01610 [Longimicrobiales bacterium]|nr:hypothetical protein [Longimicrobiales bacterium]
MPFHDDYARRTPFELAFPDQEAAEGLLTDVRAEAENRGADVEDWGAFNMLASVAGFLQRLREPDAPPEAFMDYGALAYHAYHFLTADAPVFLVTTHAVRYLVDGGPDTDRVAPPTRAGYAQLPRHLFWIHGAEEGEPAEPVDGFFWFLGSDGVLRLLLAVGMREGRPGIGVVRMPEVPFADAPTWLRADIREEGRDFATTLPGGDMEGLYSLTASGEVLKLAARLFAYMSEVPDAVGEVTSAGAAEVADGQPAPSALPFRRVTLHG